jgi:hypothetical protein
MAEDGRIIRGEQQDAERRSIGSAVGQFLTRGWVAGRRSRCGRNGEGNHRSPVGAKAEGAAEKELICAPGVPRGVPNRALRRPGRHG